MHVPWTIKAAEAGKHVLCEKPISLTVAEARTLLAVRDRTGVKIGEAFMIRSHTQWLRVARTASLESRIGQLRSIAGFFSYFNDDPANIRNHIESGGGALLDIGCYCIQAARYGFGAEPTPRLGLIDRDPPCRPTASPPPSSTSPPATPSSPAAPSSSPTSASSSSAPRGRIEIRDPLQRPQRPPHPHPHR